MDYTGNFLLNFYIVNVENHPDGNIQTQNVQNYPNGISKVHQNENV